MLISSFDARLCHSCSQGTRLSKNVNNAEPVCLLVSDMHSMFYDLFALRLVWSAMFMADLQPWWLVKVKCIDVIYQPCKIQSTTVYWSWTTKTNGFMVIVAVYIWSNGRQPCCCRRRKYKSIFPSFCTSAMQPSITITAKPVINDWTLIIFILLLQYPPAVQARVKSIYNYVINAYPFA